MTIALYQPINKLKSIEKNIWIIDGSLVYMQAYFTEIPFPTRMTIIRLNNGDLFIHSPIQLVDSLKVEIDKLGQVKHLISPNKIHYLWIKQWKQAYPEAITWASPGVREKAKNTNFERDLAEKPDPAWAKEIDQVIFQGSRYMDEVIFFHKSSRTVIITDLIENFEAERVSKNYALLARLAGSLDPDGKAPLDLRMTFWGQKEQGHKAVRQMLVWKPEKVIIAHGRCYFENGTEELKRAFRWLGDSYYIC